jgi:hypothetical protein
MPGTPDRWPACGVHLLGEYRLDFDHREPRYEVPRARVRQELVHLRSAHLLVIVLPQGARVEEDVGYLAVFSFRDEVFREGARDLGQRRSYLFEAYAVVGLLGTAGQVLGVQPWLLGYFVSDG